MRDLQGYTGQVEAPASTGAVELNRSRNPSLQELAK